jgi:hypothetical protein
MRLDSNYVRLHIVQELQKTLYARIRYDDFDVIVVDLPDRQAAAICIMEREMPVSDILDIYKDHAKSGIHTVFLLWCEMLIPEHGDIFEPPDWLLTLHTLHNQRIYAYKTVGDEVYIFPVILKRVGYGRERLVLYGSLIDVKDIGCAFMKVKGGKLEGTWRMGDFITGRRHDHTRRTYQARMGERQRQQQKQAPPPPEPNSLLTHYRLLGVSINADWETIKQAYRRLARRYHPDLNPSPQATHMMQRINAAYRHLMRHHEQKPPQAPET